METISNNPKATDTKKTTTIFINDVEVEAPEHKMTGAEIKALGNIPPANRLYREVKGNRPDIPIDDTEVVNLKKDDHFYDIPPAVKGEALRGLLPVVVQQIDRVRQDYPDLIVTQNQDGTISLEIPSYELPTGWNKTQTSIMVTVPVGYPDNKPQGFHVDPDLKLASGQGAGGLGGPNILNGKSWNSFCWNSAAWNPHQDGLWKYVKIMLSRFGDLS